MMWGLFSSKGASGYSSKSTAEQVSQVIDGSSLTAIVTVPREIQPRSVPASRRLLEAVVRHVDNFSSFTSILGAILNALALTPNRMKPGLACEDGASSGIGSETARVLALRGVHVIMGVRNISAGKEVKEAIYKQVPGAKIDAMELDLSSLASVRAFASEFYSSGLPLNILINNAGIMATPFMLSKDKIELQFATNHLGHFLLTNLLLEKMKETASKTSKEGRIVNVSSRRHRFSYPEGIRFDKINDQSGYNGLSAYGQSKLANILHTNELARRLKDGGENITANSVHPGAIATNLFRHNMLFNGVVNILGRYLVKNVQQGAATTCYVALHPEVKGTSGKYFSDCNIADTSLQGNDTEMAKKLWDLSLELSD